MDSFFSKGLQEWSDLLNDDRAKVFVSTTVNFSNIGSCVGAASLQRVRAVSVFQNSSALCYESGRNSEYHSSNFKAKWVSLVSTNLEKDDSLGLSDVHKSIEILYEWEKERKGRLASAYAVYFVESNFSNRNLAAVNELLLKTSVKRLTEWSMVAILRSSYSARDVLPGWQLFLAAVRNELKHNDRLERLLVGLSGDQ